MIGQRGRRVARLLLAVSILGLAALTLLPIGWQLNRFVVWVYYCMRGIGAPNFMTIDVYDYLLNVALFAVPTALASVAFPTVRGWVWILVGTAVSTAIELTQWVALPREASWVDVTSNTVGATVGALGVWLCRTRWSSDHE